MESKINDKYIIEAINVHLKKYNNEELSESEIEKVNELNLNNKTFSGENKDIDLSQIKELKNISSLELQYFEISDNVIEILQQLKKIKRIALISCKYIAKKELKLEGLNSLDLRFCNIKNGYKSIIAPSILTIQDCENINLKKLKGKEKVEKLIVNNCEINGFSAITQFTSLKSINIDGSKVDDLDILPEIKCQISYKETSYPME